MRNRLVKYFVFSVFTSLGLCLSSSVFAAQLTNIQQFLADVSGSNPGLELIVPHQDYGLDYNGDGLPDTASMRFDIYKPADAAGVNKVKLYSTLAKTINLVVFPCDPYTTAWMQLYSDSSFLRDKSFALAVSHDAIQCVDSIGAKVAHKTNIYKSNTSVSTGGTVWSYDYELLGIGLVNDMNGNGFKEVMIGLYTPNTVTGGYDAWVIIRDISNGVIISSGKYPVYVP